MINSNIIKPAVLKLSNFAILNYDIINKSEVIVLMMAIIIICYHSSHLHLVASEHLSIFIK